MTDFFFITRLDDLKFAFSLISWLSILSGIILVCWAAGTYLMRASKISDKGDKEWSPAFSDEIRELGRRFKYLKKWAFLFLAVFLTSLTLNVITPTTKDAYLIFGLGNTLEYCRSNKRLQDLPPKVIEAMNLYADKIIEDLQPKTEDLRPEEATDTVQ